MGLYAYCRSHGGTPLTLTNHETKAPCIALDAERVFWATNDSTAGTILGKPKAGGAAETLARLD